VLTVLKERYLIVLVPLLMSNCSAFAQSLNGSVSQTDQLTEPEHVRIARPPLDGSVYQSGLNGHANESPSGWIEDVPKTAPLEPAAQPSQPVSGKTNGGQDEYWVNWDAWRHRIADAVWGPLKAQGILMWGSTGVDYDVSRDHHIRIVSVQTPDPTGASGRTLASAIMRLDGNPILEFPAGSHQLVHRNRNMHTGLPRPSGIGGMINLPGGAEHVTSQW
jgi:hypothetical protein